MGQPNDSPLYDGLDSSWNDVVSAFPEDRRDELAGALKSRIDAYEPLKQWEDFTKSGITPDQAGQALNVYSTIENDPRRVYEAIGKHLGITPQQVQDVMEEEIDEDDDPRLAALQKQVEIMSQIMVTEKQQSAQAQLAQQAEASIDKDLDGLKKKYGDIDEDEIITRMLYKNMTPEEAYTDYNNKFAQIRARRPSPLVLGGGGQVPQRSIDPTKLDSKDTKNLVAQILQHANEQAKQ